jgi:hypothetical protein
MPDRVIVEVLIAAPIDRVRKALRDPKEIGLWFGWDYPTLDQDIQMMFPDGIVEDVSSPGFSDRFVVEDAGTHTVVRVIRSAPVSEGTWQGIYDDTAQGWVTFLQQLKFALERHAGQTRRTVYLNGRAKDAATLPPVFALNLHRLATVPVGERYEIATPAGETLRGTIQYRAAGDDLGLTVDDYGEGLLVLNTRPRTAKSLHGGGAIVITTYGMDDSAFAAMRARWEAWWTHTYEVIEIR